MYFVTSNKNKYKEFNSILGNLIDLRMIDIDLTEIQGTPVEIAISKCEEAYEKVDQPILIEDTSLSFNALNGLPGPYIKDFYKAIGNNGLYKMIENFEDKSAIARTVIAYKDSFNSKVQCFVGETYGTIVKPLETNMNGFDWDNIFQTDIVINDVLCKRRYSEMTPNQKNTVSHRRRAINQFFNYIISEYQ